MGQKGCREANSCENPETEINHEAITTGNGNEDQVAPLSRSGSKLGTGKADVKEASDGLEAAAAIDAGSAPEVPAISVVSPEGTRTLKPSPSASDGVEGNEASGAYRPSVAGADTGAPEEEGIFSMLKGAVVDTYAECKDVLLGSQEEVEEHELPKVKRTTSDGFFIPQNRSELRKLIRKMPVIMRESACTKAPESGRGPPMWRSIWKTTAAELGEYGVGIQLYFELLMAMGVLFLVLFLINFPTVVLCLMGSGIDDNAQTRGVFLNWLSKFTIANLGHCEEGNLCDLDWAVERKLYRGSEQNLKEVTWIIGILDSLSTVLFLAFGLGFIHWWIPKRVQKHDADNLTAADFALEVSGLPWCLDGDRKSELHGRYEQELADHFKRVLMKNPDNDSTEEDPVHEVALIRDYGGYIRQFINIGYMRTQEANVKARLGIAKFHGDTPKVELFEKKLVKFAKEIQDADDSMGEQGDMIDEQRGVCSAFVMFKTESLKDFALLEYAPYSDFLSLMHQPPDLQFHGSKIQCAQACEPLDLYWENLDYNKWRRLARQAFMFFVAICIVVFCTAVLVNLRFYKVKHLVQEQAVVQHYVLAPAPESYTWNDDGTLPTSDARITICHWEMYTAMGCKGRSIQYPRRISSGPDQAAPRLTLGMDIGPPQPGQSFCSTADLEANYGSSANAAVPYLAYQLPDQLHMKCTKIATSRDTRSVAMYACKTWNETAPNFITQCKRLQNPFHKVHNDERQHKGVVAFDIACSNTVSLAVAHEAFETAGDPTEDPTVKCFCEQQGAAAVKGEAFEVCKDYLWKKGMKLVVMACSIGAVCTINIVLNTVFYYMDEWTRHRTMTTLTTSQMLKLFFALFVNTAVIFILVSANMHVKLFTSLSGIGMDKLGNGPFSDISRQWFVVSGQDFFLTALVNIGCFTVTPLAFSFILNPFFIRFFRQGLVTESALREVYKLPEWPLSLRLAQNVTTFFCVMMFCGGMPLMYLIGALYCLTSYWADKICLLRGSQLPPTYHEDLVSHSMNWAFTAGFLHVAMTSWMYGYQEIFPSNWSNITGFYESLFNMSLAQYDATMNSWFQLVGSGQENFEAYLHARMLDISRQGGVVVAIFLSAYLLYFFVHHLLWLMLIRPFTLPMVTAFMRWRYATKREKSRQAFMSRSRTNLELTLDKVIDNDVRKFDSAPRPSRPSAGPVGGEVQESASEAELRPQIRSGDRKVSIGSSTSSQTEHISEALQTREVHKIFSYKMENNPKYLATYKALKFCEHNDDEFKERVELEEGKAKAKDKDAAAGSAARSSDDTTPASAI